MTGDNTLFLYGTDEFAITRRLAEIQAHHDKDGINTARLDSRTASQEELNNALNALPFLSDKRLVFLANPSTRSSQPAERQKFLDFLLAAPESTLVVLYEAVEFRNSEKHWIVKRALAGDFKSQAFFMPRLYEMPVWMIAEAKRQGGQMEKDAAVLLAEKTGEDTRVAAQEITKLLTYVAHSRPVSIIDVESLSILSAQGDIFALVDALASGDGKNAQKVLHQLLEKDDPHALWGMIIRQFRLLLQAREIMDAGGSKFDIKETLGLHEYVAGKIFAQALRFSLASLETLYHRLLEMDEGAKNGQVALDLSLDILVMQLTEKK